MYSWKETETSRVEIEIPGAPNLVDYVEKKGSLVGAPAALADPSSIQEVLMPNGDFVDVGHVLAGLDALNYPATASGPLGTLSVASNVGAVTWIGDIASIVGEIVVKTLNRKKSAFTDAELQAEIDRMAPVQDMIGNIDAYAIGRTFAISSASGAKVSDMLEQYYGGPGLRASPARRRGGSGRCHRERGCGPARCQSRRSDQVGDRPGPVAQRRLDGRRVTHELRQSRRDRSDPAGGD